MRERAKESNTTHGMSKSKLRTVYTNMLTRCYNPKYKSYDSYGGRGIKVSDEWKSKGGYGRFVKWAYENGYSPELTLDRIDVNGNYEPSNCRWATMKQQQNNRRNNAVFEYNGARKTIAEWAEEIGVSYGKLQMTLYRNGGSVEKAVEKFRG